MKRLLALVAGLAATAAFAHPSFSSPRATAGASQRLTIDVGHGCEGADTSKIELHIPAGVTSVRPMHAEGFGRAVVSKDETSGNVQTITWAKSGDDVLAEDTHLYRFTFSARLPEKPFTRVHFRVVQTCTTAMGEELVSDWKAEGDHDHGGGHGGGHGDELPAASVFVMPPLKPGWNRFTIEEHVHDLTVFDDALIVWAGKAAYSSNARTRELLANEPDVQLLDAIHPGTEIWVKY